MAGIHENLKQLRLSQNLTQEEVAQKIGLTRQAISSYESGRTQPGIELLMRFAEIYKVELEDILYGRRAEQTAEKRLWITGSLLLVFWWLLHLLHGGFVTALHILFAPGSGALAGEAIRTYFRLLERAEGIMGVGLLLSIGGWLLLLALDLSDRRTISWKRKAVFFAQYTAGALAAAFFWAWMDPVYSVWDFQAAVAVGTEFAALILAVDLAILWLRKRKQLKPGR